MQRWRCITQSSDVSESYHTLSRLTCDAHHACTGLRIRLCISTYQRNIMNAIDAISMLVSLQYHSVSQWIVRIAYHYVSQLYQNEAFVSDLRYRISNVSYPYHMQRITFESLTCHINSYQFVSIRITIICIRALVLGDSKLILQ